MNPIIKGSNQLIGGLGGSGGGFNFDQNKNTITSKDWVQTTLKVTDENRDKIKASFAEWVEDESYFPLYDHLEIVRPGFVILRFFIYREPIKIPILGKKDQYVDRVDALGKIVTSDLMLPYVKIIKTGPSMNNPSTVWKPGSIGIMSDLILKAQVNPKWLGWEKKTKERSTANGGDGIPFEAMHELEPKKYINGLENWEGSEVVLDKFDPQLYDEITYLRPSSEISFRDKGLSPK